MPRILVVEDEVNMRRLLAAILRQDGQEVVTVAGLAEARRELAAGLFDLVVTDQRLPDGEGIALVADCRDNDPALPVVVLTAFATVGLAVEAMRRGAFDFLTKPFEPEQVQAVVRRGVERSRLARENERLRAEVARREPGAGELLGESPPMQHLREMIARVGPTHATVLIQGETGTGKELVARALHAASPRAGRPFLAVNCAALTETLLDSELFGHERGAFTGADRARPGLFEAAHGGTLFLDEAAEMSLSLQAKLLRAVVSGEVVRVGSTTSRRVDVRILVATHRDLAERVREGSFREDLYYRLAVVPIVVPPLRARREDLSDLAAHLLVEIARELKMEPRRLTPAALTALRSYSFPGNVRELRNLLERASILAHGVAIDAGDFPFVPGEPDGEDGAGDPLAVWLAAQADELDLRATIAEIECGIIRRSLAAAGGNQAEAARRLGVSRSDLSYKLRRLGLAGRGQAAGEESTPRAGHCLSV